jgi:alkanesulfonate monooxygenase SsuD/methylene tetrahydromethanopterin reductase-like flavin-dependent oxidoreductase (luciferase family)
VIKCWTEPGPFRFEGKHFHFRFVNPWALPYQKPHPQVWIPGLLSPESVLWAAEHRYPYFGFGGGLDKTAELQEIYADKAAELGYQAGPENFGYLQSVLVAETDEKAVELGRNFLWAGGGANFARPEWTLPPGYNSKDATRRLARAQQRTAVLGIGANPEQSGTEAGGARTRLARGEIDMEEARKALYAGYDDACKSFQIVVGSPRTVIEKCRKTLEVLRPGLYSISQASGPLTHDQRQTSIRLFGQEVAPLLREIGKSLGLVNSYQVKPGSRPLPASGKRDPASNPAALAL